MLCSCTCEGWSAPNDVVPPYAVEMKIQYLTIVRRIKYLAVAMGVLAALTVSPLAHAVENGTDATGNGIVVPILVKMNAAGDYGACSGALISPSVVATAGHCLLDSSGVGSNDILVGPPGTSHAYNAATWTHVTNSIFSVDYQGPSAAGMVTAGDIAFITLAANLPQTTKVYLPSENQLTTLKSSSAKLRIIGYGDLNDAGDPSYFPNYFDAQYSSYLSSDVNSSWAESTGSDICLGDSGSPVLSITPTKIIIVGIVTGAILSKHCSVKQANGKYVSQFTVMNRYSNLGMAAMGLALDAALSAVTSAQDGLNQKTTQLNSANDSKSQLQTDLDQASNDLDAANNSIIDLKAQIALYKSAGFKIITCVAGAKSKSVIAIKPKCPIGYKLQK